MEEYNALLALCRPLMRFFTPAGRDRFPEFFEEFEARGADSIVKACCFSAATMPASFEKHAGAEDTGGI
jgi:hypothetical protein